VLKNIILVYKLPTNERFQAHFVVFSWLSVLTS